MEMTLQNIELRGWNFMTSAIKIIGHANRAEEVSEEHYSPCSCAISKNKSLCGGPHWNLGFKDDKS